VASVNIEPGLPRDPHAASASVEWALSRNNAVEQLDLDHRVVGILDALNELDLLIDEAGQEVLTHELLDESEVEVVESPTQDTVETFLKAEKTGRAKLASMETVVLPGLEVTRKLRLQQSISSSHMADGLFRDVRALFEIGDREGALVSLERLIVVAPMADQIESFLDHNESRLLNYYQSVFGPFSRVPKLTEGEPAMPAGYFRMAKVHTIASLIDGQRTVTEVIDGSGLRKIEACAVLSQLVRSSAVEVSPLQC
jgi:hypothetical protein